MQNYLPQKLIFFVSHFSLKLLRNSMTYSTIKVLKDSPVFPAHSKRTRDNIMASDPTVFFSPNFLRLNFHEDKGQSFSLDSSITANIAVSREVLSSQEIILTFHEHKHNHNNHSEL